MTTIHFTYSTQQGKEPLMQMSAQDRFDFETGCTISLTKKYGDNLITPQVHAVVSEHTGNVLRCYLFVSAVLKPDSIN